MSCDIWIEGGGKEILVIQNECGKELLGRYCTCRHALAELQTFLHL